MGFFLGSMGGSAITFKRAYDPSLAYKKNDTVSLSGSIYICIKNAPAGISPTNNTYWDIYQAAGSASTAIDDSNINTTASTLSASKINELISSKTVALEDLSDVNTTNKTNNNVLAYDMPSDSYVLKTPNTSSSMSSLETEFTIKDTWTTVGIRNMPQPMYRLFVVNLGTDKVTFKVNGMTINVLPNEEFDEVLNPFTTVEIVSGTFFAKAYALRSGSPYPKYVLKDYFDGDTGQERMFTGAAFSLTVCNDGYSDLLFTANDLVFVVAARSIEEEFLEGFTSVSVNSNSPYRVLVKGLLTDTISGYFPDNTAPNEITYLHSSVVTATSATIEWTSSNSIDIDHYEIYSYQSKIGTTKNNNYTITGLTEKTSYNITVKSVDKSGNVSSGVTFTLLTSDITPPANVTNLAASSITQNSVMLNWTGSSSTDTSGYDIYNSSSYVGTTTVTNYTLTGLTAGTNYTFNVKAKDSSGNISSGSSISVTTSVQVVDSTPPTLTFNPPPGLYNASKTVSISPNESSKIYYTTDGSTPTVSSTLYSSPINTGTVGPFSIKAIGVDDAGNVSTVYTATYTFDMVVPSVTLNASPGWTYNTASVTVSMTSSKVGGVIYYTLDGTAPNTSSSIYTSPLSLTGNKPVKAIVKDPAGNISSVASSSIVYDITPPGAPTVSDISDIKDTSAVIKYDSLDARTMFIYSDSGYIDGTTQMVSNIKQARLLGLPKNNTTNVYLKSVDEAGNISYQTSVALTTTNLGTTPTDGTVNDASLKVWGENLSALPLGCNFLHNPQNYFVGNGDFTFTYTGIIPKYSSVLHYNSPVSGLNNTNKLYIKMDGSSTISWYLKTIDNSNSTTKDYGGQSSVVSNSENVHIVLLRRGTSLIFKVNNIIVSSLTIPSTHELFPSTTNDSPCLIGGAILSGTSLVKHFAIYNRGLTDTELTQNYNVLK
ncbi:hypothetical protein F4V43_02610 [Paenibacillus spiritus]|uniref:Fibronectin type-III domain-containing protein n=1 Tax=Paenibacillus spiritus TaxID=2496557 RepID=A0A5J5GH31_9BACL|nr:chitobiase/beta-hexosaminidase C-terminal domain-containing protein [Paenibacillus spiritus]KAA9007397.1 hypothetical protein F4V43_02610 [Paenibacillus spiritus]